MRIPRIYHPYPLLVPCKVDLSEEASHHVTRVLRRRPGDILHLFDGTNHIFPAEIIDIQRKRVQVCVSAGITRNCESPLYLHLGQVISRGEKMEFTIQKAVELGVTLVTPLISARCGVKLDEQRMHRKQVQWQKIAIAACEQCGRNIMPIIRPVMMLGSWCAEADEALKLNLHPRANARISTLPAIVKRIRLLIGPEGGLSKEEITMTSEYQFTDILLGPRVLRTETTALTAITALQTRFGDLG